MLRYTYIARLVVPSLHNCRGYLDARGQSCVEPVVRDKRTDRNWHRYEYKVFLFVMEQFTLELYVAGPTILALKLLQFTRRYGAIYKPSKG
jgi:hypothetical protein